MTFDKAAWSRARYQRRREAGLCVECGDRPAREGGVRCEECQSYTRARDRERRADSPDAAAMRSALNRVLAGDSIPDALAYAGIDTGRRQRMEPPPLEFLHPPPERIEGRPEPPPERECSACGNLFRVTDKRRRLCYRCHTNDGVQI